MTQNPVVKQQSKHIEMDVHFVRDKVMENTFIVKYVATKDQPADIFTKALYRTRFQELRDKLPVSKCPSA